MLVKDSLESTMRFKYLRSLEALMEATPQAVLQLVYLMRTSALTSNIENNGNELTNLIYIFSIFQSLISITNSTINADNMYMSNIRYKEYKKRFPPTFSFLKHFLFRACEASYRILLFSIFWTVVGGEWFMLMLCCEFLFPIVYSTVERDITVFFLSLNTLVLMPPELVFVTTKDNRGFDLMNWICDHNPGISGIVITPSVGRHVAPLERQGTDTVFLSSESDVDGKQWAPSKNSPGEEFKMCFLPCAAVVACIWCILLVLCCPACKDSVYFVTSLRIFFSCCELGVILIYATYITTEQDEKDYLYSRDHSWYMFIACSVCFGIYWLFYTRLMPNIRLPGGVHIRSKLGYAYFGNIDELERLYQEKRSEIDSICIAKFKKNIYNDEKEKEEEEEKEKNGNRKQKNNDELKDKDKDKEKDIENSDKKGDEDENTVRVMARHAIDEYFDLERYKLVFPLNNEIEKARKEIEATDQTIKDIEEYAMDKENENEIKESKLDCGKAIENLKIKKKAYEKLIDSKEQDKEMIKLRMRKEKLGTKMRMMQIADSYLVSDNSVLSNYFEMQALQTKTTGTDGDDEKTKEEFDVSQHIIALIPTVTKPWVPFWENCINNAKANDEFKTVSWLEQHGAVETKGKKEDEDDNDQNENKEEAGDDVNVDVSIEIPVD